MQRSTRSLAPTLLTALASQGVDQQEQSKNSRENNAMPPKGSGKRKVTAPSAAVLPTEASVPQTPTLAETLSYLSYPRPFKNPAYTKNAARRTRTLKSVLSQERERERQERERRRAEREAVFALPPASAVTEKTSASSAGDGEEGGEGNNADADRMDVDDNPPQSAQEKQESEQMRMKLSVIEEEEDIPTYTSIEAPPSILPQKRYCDITGLEAPYTDPATGLRYHDKSIYEFIKTVNASTVKEYLTLRGVNPIVK